MLTSFTKLERRLLAVLLAVALLSQVVILVAGRTNPLQNVPLNDAKVYWEWAGDVGRGEWVSTTPFMSAPLYPYLIGLVRALGGGLASVFALQVVLHLATIVLIAKVGARRFSPLGGLLAASLYVLFLDSAFYTGRVLNCTPQAFATMLVWDRAVALHDQRDLRRALVFGAVLGVSILANPTFLPLVFVFALWIWWSDGRGAHALGKSAAATLVALVCIAPAAYHNWVASREFIPLSAQAGITFYHGNQPGAEGVYHAAAGVSTDRVKQTFDAREAVRGESDGTWKGTSDAYFARGIAFWRADPGAALALAARKMWWFVSGRNYGDVYVPTIERDDGLAPFLWLAPMPVAWWTLPAIVALFVLARRPIEVLPDLALFSITFVIVVTFWYSPRYRAPVDPMIAVLAGGAMSWVIHARKSLNRAAAVLVSLGASIGLSLALASGADDKSRFRAQFEQAVGIALVEERRFEEALARFDNALRLGLPAAAVNRADLLRRMGKDAEALSALQAAAAREPTNVFARRSLAVALAEAHRLDEARVEFEAVIGLDPNDFEALMGLGNVLLESGAAERAVASHDRAIVIAPRNANVLYNRAVALEALQRYEDAEKDLQAAIVIAPGLVRARARLSDLLFARGAVREGIAQLERAHADASDDERVAQALAWSLATAPIAETRDGARALALAQRLLERELAHRTGPSPQLLDTLAAACAEAGRFEDARRHARACLDIVRRMGPLEAIPDVEARLALYEKNQPYHQDAR